MIGKKSRMVLLVFVVAGPMAFQMMAEMNPGKKTKKTTETVVEPAVTVGEKPAVSLKYSNPTVAPEVPDEVVFCGKTIDLRKNDMRERFDRELMSMVFMHSTSLTLLKKANRYFPILEKILDDSGVPEDMKYLACIESSLNPRAVSAAKAVGMWQFMPETARQYGLEVSTDVDERYDFEKETVAACRYLKDAYARFGDWPTAAASYNAGTARISSELIRQGASNSFDLWLVEETTRYVFRILACKHFMANPKQYGFYLTSEQLYPPVQCRDTIVTGKVSNWVDFAKSQGITFYELKAQNSWIRNDSLPNPEMKAYKVSIPLAEGLIFDKKKMKVHQENWVTEEQ